MRSITNTVLSSIGAIFATRRSVPGTIVFFDQSSSSNSKVVSCTPETVTIITDNNDAALEPGHILAYVGSGGSDDDAFCAEECNALFRKITSRKDKNTFYTQLVTVADIFPNSMYEKSMANTLIEPMFQCYDEEDHRFLSDGDNDDDFTGSGGDSFCTTAAYIAVISCLVGLPFGPFGWPCFLLSIIFLLILYNYWTCGVVGDDDDRILNGALHAATFLVSLTTRRLGETYSREEPLALFPTRPNEWTKTDGAGNCLYTSCNIRATDGNDNSSNCFWCSNGCCGQELSNNRMVHFPIPSATKFDFAEALHSQEMCYSSNFDKATCDVFFYKTMKESCPIEQQYFSGMLPLSESDLTQNCNMMTVLFYLGMKGSGNDAYVKLQLEQHMYENDECRSMVQTSQL